MKIIFKIILITQFIYPFISSDVSGENGLVVSSKVQASEIGINIMKNGGNAIDAAIAVCFALSVTHPSAGNLGGGGFIIIKFANGTSTAIDFRETAPYLSSEKMFLDIDGNVIDGMSTSSSLSVGVPGTVAGMGYIHEKYGTLPWEDLLYPSFLLAKYGFNLDQHNFYLFNSPLLINKLSSDKESHRVFVDNKNYNLNELMIQEDLAETLLRLTEYGYKEFYFGQTANNIISCMNRKNGIISLEDLSSYKVSELSPIEFKYRDYNVLSMPPSSSGGITLAIILNQLENLDFSNIMFQDYKHVHYMSEISKRAYVDRYKYMGDIDFVNIPVDYLISQNYADSIFHSISDTLSFPSTELYESIKVTNNESEETTHYSIIDKFGNCVSVTTTLNGWFGSGITVDNSGFLLNNEMDDFSVKPGYPNMYGIIGSEKNSIKPKKRMLSSMTPTIVTTNDDLPFLITGSPGGSTIITTVAQVISNVIDFKMNIKDAVESKRFHQQWFPDIIQIEKNSINTEVINKLIDAKHNLVYRSDTGLGEANSIMIINDIYYGASDSRRGAKAVAY
tara:strand:+ start:1047 stop:2732 length:1686 start_codon:yes stop_codon:yes gene_type:complete